MKALAIKYLHYSWSEILSNEKATTALAGFHARSSIQAELEFEDVGFVERGKPEDPEKNFLSRAKTNLFDDVRNSAD